MFFRSPRGGTLLWDWKAGWTAGSNNQGDVKSATQESDHLLLSLTNAYFCFYQKNSQPPEDHSPISRKEFVRFLMATPTKSELRCQVMLREIVSKHFFGGVLTPDPAALTLRDWTSAVGICLASICATLISRWPTWAAAICHMLICAVLIWSGPTFLEPYWM